MSNKIEIPQRTTFTFDVSVYGINDIAGYTPTINVRKKTSDADLIFTSTGVVADASGKVSFTVSSTDSSIAKLDYNYKIILERDASRYRPIYDTLSIID